MSASTRTHWLLRLLAASIALLVLTPTLVSASTIKVLNNSALRFGNGTQDSITNKGLLEQPWYYSKTSNVFRPLTYSTFALDFAFGYGSNGLNWNGNTVYDWANVSPSSINIDYSGLSATGGGINGGWGTIGVDTTFTLGGNPVEFKHTYSLGQTDDFIRIETKVTNRSANPLAASSIWVGTRDDWVGSTDAPTKRRGNVSEQGFAVISNAADPSNAVEITSGAEGVLFYSVTPNAASVIRAGRGFAGLIAQNPTTAPIELSGDQSYAMYLPVGDLAPQASATIVWFYAAGSIQDLANAARAVADAAAADQTLDALTETGGTLAYQFNYPGTAYFAVVDRDAPEPSAAQIISGDFEGVRAAGNAALTGSGSSFSHEFEITGLQSATRYTVYTLARYDDPNDADDPPAVINSDVASVNFATLSAAPVGISVTPASQQVSVALNSEPDTTNYQYSIDGTTWVTRSPASTASPWVIGGLTNGTSYNFQFRSIFDGRPGVASEVFTVTAGAVPTAPRALGATFIAGGGANIRWSQPVSDGGNEVLGYAVEYRVGDDWLALTHDGLTAQVPAVTVGQNWFFRVAATNVIGTGAFATFTYNAPAPAPLVANGPPSLVTPANQPSVTATPGQSVTGTVSGGVVTPGTATVRRVTAASATDIKTEAENILEIFNSKWGGAGELTAPPVSIVETQDGAMIFGLLAGRDSTPIGVPATDVLLVESAGQAVMLAAATQDQPASINQSGALVVTGGGLLGVAAHGFDPGVRGELLLLSEPTLLGEFTIDADGSFIGQASIPQGFPAGDHTIVLITDGLVTSMGLVVQAPTRQPQAIYRGPLISSFSSKLLPSGQQNSVTLLGSRLDAVITARVGGKSVTFTRNGTGELVLTLPALEPGTYDLVITSSFGTLTYQSAFTVYQSTAPTERDPAGPIVNVGSFNGKLVVYSLRLEGATVSWRVAGQWRTAQVGDNSLTRFHHPIGVDREVLVQIYVNGELALTKVVRTR